VSVGDFPDLPNATPDGHTASTPFPLAPVRGVVRPTVPLGDLELRIFDGGMRWKLQPTGAVEIWKGARHLGTLSGRALCMLVEIHLANAALAAAIRSELDHPTAPAEPVIETRRKPARRMPARPVITTEQKEALRALRRTPRKKR
jgi:hypothetical protein